MKKFKSFKKGLSVALSALMLVSSLPDMGLAMENKAGTKAEETVGESSINHYGSVLVEAGSVSTVEIDTNKLDMANGSELRRMVVNGSFLENSDYYYISGGIGHSGATEWESINFSNDDIVEMSGEDYSVDFDMTRLDSFDFGDYLTFNVWWSSGDLYVSYVDLYYADGTIITCDIEDIMVGGAVPTPTPKPDPTPDSGPNLGPSIPSGKYVGTLVETGGMVFLSAEMMERDGESPESIRVYLYCADEEGWHGFGGALGFASWDEDYYQESYELGDYMTSQDGNHFSILFDMATYENFGYDNGYFLFQKWWSADDLYFTAIELTYSDGQSYEYDFADFIIDEPEIENPNVPLYERIYFDSEINVYEGIDTYEDYDYIYDATLDEYVEKIYTRYGYEKYLNTIPLWGVYEDGSLDVVELNGYSYSCTDNQFNNQWEVGESYSVKFSIDGTDLETELIVNILPNPVERITIDEDYRIELIENLDGIVDTYYDEELGERDVFHYNYESQLMYDLVYTVYYTDGHFEEVYGYELPVEWKDAQLDSVWEAGNDYTVYVEYAGFKVPVTISIIENSIADIEWLGDTNIQVEEETNGYWESYYYWDENDDYVEGSYYVYDLEYIVDETLVGITYTDGSYEEKELYKLGSYVRYNTNQYNIHWTVGNTYNATVTCYGYDIDLTVEIIASRIVNVELFDKKPIEVVEGSNGYIDWMYVWDEEIGYHEEPFFIYNCYELVEDLIVKFTYVDGTVEFKRLKDVEYGINHDQSITSWAVGGTYDCSIVIGKYEVPCEFSIIENPIESVEPADSTPIEVVEHVDGHWEVYEDWDEVEEKFVMKERFIYSLYGIVDDYMLNVNYKDGHSEKVRVDVADLLIEQQRHDGTWDEVGSYEIVLKYDEIEYTVAINVVENNIDHIEVVDKFTAIYEVDGYEISGYWDDETDDWVDYEYFMYDIYEKLYDNQLKVVYKDGSYEFIDMTGGKVSFEQDRSPVRLEIGDVYYFTLTYRGFEIAVPVTIIENTITDVKVVDGESIDLYKYFDSWDSDGSLIYFYRDIMFSTTSLELTYASGDKELIQVGPYMSWNEEINQYETEWQPGNSYNVDINYAGFTCTIKINIKPCPVKNVEPIIETPLSFYEKIDGYECEDWVENEDGEYELVKYTYYSYYELFYKLKFKITYNDGTTEVISADELQEKYSCSVLCDQAANEWTPDKDNFFYIKTCGVYMEIPVTIKKLSVNPYINLDETQKIMPTETEFQLNANYATNVSGNAIEWTSSDERVATVDSNGLVTAHRYGHAVITATLIENGMTATCEIDTLFYDVAGSNIKGAPDYQYFYDPVYWAASNGITTGYDKVYFGPSQLCTRQELLIFLWRVAGQPKAKGDARKYFSDVKDGTNTATNKSIAWAYENGITKGYTEGGKTLFKPKNSVTRQETMIFLWRVAGEQPTSGSLTFTDCKGLNKNSATYKAVLWGSKNGITSGYSDGTFGLTGDCLREAIVTFLYRFNNKYHYIK